MATWCAETRVGLMKVMPLGNQNPSHTSYVSGIGNMSCVKKTVALGAFSLTQGSERISPPHLTQRDLRGGVARTKQKANDRGVKS
jgi:hypothetical protein